MGLIHLGMHAASGMGEVGHGGRGKGASGADAAPEDECSTVQYHVSHM